MCKENFWKFSPSKQAHECRGTQMQTFSSFAATTKSTKEFHILSLIHQFVWRQIFFLSYKTYKHRKKRKCCFASNLVSLLQQPQSAIFHRFAWTNHIIKEKRNFSRKQLSANETYFSVVPIFVEFSRTIFAKLLKKSTQIFAFSSSIVYNFYKCSFMPIFLAVYGEFQTNISLKLAKKSSILGIHVWNGSLLYLGLKLCKNSGNTVS